MLLEYRRQTTIGHAPVLSTHRVMESSRSMISCGLPPMLFVMLSHPVSWLKVVIYNVWWAVFLWQEPITNTNTVCIWGGPTEEMFWLPQVNVEMMGQFGEIGIVGKEYITTTPSKLLLTRNYYKLFLTCKKDANVQTRAMSLRSVLISSYLLVPLNQLTLSERLYHA